MKFRNCTKLILIVAALAMILSFAACGGEGALKLESFTVDLSSIKTTYLIGEEVDFSGIKATAKYSDENLNKTYTFSELTVDCPADVTATAGSKDITVSFQDPHLNVKQTATFKITVKQNSGDNPGETDPLIAVQFEKPSNLTQFATANKNAGSKEYGTAGFYGEFAVGDQIYKIGTENEFKLNPMFAILNEDGVVEEVEEFFSVVDIYVEANGEYVALTKTAGDGNTVTYTDANGTLIATVDTFHGTYQFTNDAAGKKVKISVLPSEEHYLAADPFNAVVLEAALIRAYNVYEAWQLAVIDNVNEQWNDFKTEHGIANVTVSGIVLHTDLHLTADDVPDSFFYTTTKDVVYTNTATQATVTVPAGTKYVIDQQNIYERLDRADFVIEGNFFTLDTGSFPLVPSPAVFGKDAEKDYGSDFSNVSLFRFLAVTEEEHEADPFAKVSNQVSVNNLALIGNSKRDALIDENENLASAGSLILVKSSYLTNLNVNNVIGNSYFISYFPEHGHIIARNTKCYDSYQNAAFVWGESSLTIEDSYFEGCGGPVIIAQSLIDDDWHPTVTVNGSVMKTLVTGEEIWFTAVNATSIVGSIKGLGDGLEMAGLGNFVGSDGKMNILGALMAKGTSATEIITGLNAEGSILVDGKGMNRNQTAENVDWTAIKTISEFAQASGGQMPPFLTVQDANGVNYTIYFNGTKFVDMQGRELGTDASHAALVAAFNAADTVTLTQGGLSVVFELYHD